MSDTAIFVTPAEDQIPIGVTFPCIGLKDGPVTKEIEYGKGTTYAGYRGEFAVDVLIYVLYSAGEAPVMGDGAAKGTLDIRADIHGILMNNSLGVSGIHSGYCPEEGESQLMQGTDFAVLRKRLTYNYLKFENSTI